jgi:hypothetical protein
LGEIVSLDHQKHKTMKKIFSIAIIFLGISMAVSSCQAIKITKIPHNPDTSLLFICKFNGLECIYVSLENRETHEKYESTALVGIGIASSVVYNLPKGTYDVVKVWFQTGVGNTVQEFSNWSPELAEYFGPIEIEPNNKYFLGIYKGYCKGIPVFTVRDHIKLEYVEESVENWQDYVPKKIRTEIAKTDWKDGEFIILRPAKYNEVFDFY